ncbi:peroxidase 66-like [Curcuma longa]|uniref:peroxidase 66-like n=1 Tax=Curcuma longa TaxID=136217 RepID=UPI003D9EEADA
MTALSGAHTIGQAQCSQFDDRIYNDRNINATFAALLRRTCPRGGSNALAPLDGETPYRFDNGYYRELVAQRGLLQSDQVLFNGGSQDGLVRRYSVDGAAFARDFAAAMVKMGALSPRPETAGEVRLVCNRVN